jgi:hypothetical protein
VPFPCPLAPDEAMPSQSVSLRAVQEHSRLTVTVSVPLPPAAAAVGVVAVSVGTQRDDDGAVTLVVDEDPQLAQNNNSSARSARPRLCQVNRVSEDVCDIGPRERRAINERVQPHVARELR